MRPCILLVTCLLACGHSEPFATAASRETGPFLPGPEARIAPLVDAHWSQDGRSIVFQTTCYTAPPAVNTTRIPPGVGRVGGMQAMPPTGGSISWERCETRPEYTLRTDTTEVFPAVALRMDGKVLYVEMVRDFVSGSAQRPHYPIHSHADLWMADTGGPFPVRRHLLTLYHNTPLGHTTVSDSTINYLANATWIGGDAFIAEASNLRPDSTFTHFGLIRGMVTGDSATLTVIPGTTPLWRWSMARGAASAMFFDDSVSMELRRVSVGGGGVTVVATLPSASHRRIADLSCREDLCLVTTNENATPLVRTSTFWTVSLSTGSLQLLRTDVKNYSLAQLSPTANLVLVGEPDGIHLFSELIH